MVVNNYRTIIHEKFPLLKYLPLLHFGPISNHQFLYLQLTKMARKLTQKIVSNDIENNVFVSWDSNILRSFSLPRGSPMLLFIILFLVFVQTSQSQLELESSWNHKGLSKFILFSSIYELNIFKSQILYIK